MKTRNIIFNLLTILMLCLFSSYKATTDKVDMGEVLKKADFYRGGVDGISWDLKVKNIEQGVQKDEITLLVEASVNEEHFFSLITFLAPKKYENQKLLIRDNNMWFIKAGLRGPVPISGRQRLSGRASNADIASADYYKDYTITKTTEGELDGTPCWIMDLYAKNNLVSYPMIRYWISKKENFGLKAEFYGKSDKLIKAASFEYNNDVEYKSKRYKYISKITIYDNINKEDKTILDLSRIRFESFNNSKFQKDRLLD